MLTHVVMMKFEDRANREEAKARLEALASEIEQINTLSVGLDELATPVSWDLVLTTTHDDAEALVAYQQHPAHQEFGGWLRPLLTERCVVDFTA